MCIFYTVTDIPAQIISVAEKLSWFFRHLSDGLLYIGILISIPICEISSQTSGPSHPKCLMCVTCLMISWTLGPKVRLCISHVFEFNIAPNIKHVGTVELGKKNTQLHWCQLFSKWVKPSLCIKCRPEALGWQKMSWASKFSCRASKFSFFFMYESCQRWNSGQQVLKP